MPHRAMPGHVPDAPQARAALHHPGTVDHERLPAVMGGLDTALMPFALNDATRPTGPTPTPEYMAAGLPVVSTHVPDVVAEFADVVALHDDATGFAGACEEALARADAARERRVRRTLRLRDRDVIAARMRVRMQEAAAPPADATARGTAADGGAR
jgi:glycosyltransferase involved in cell wall biosynthesis